MGDLSDLIDGGDSDKYVGMTMVRKKKSKKNNILHARLDMDSNGDESLFSDFINSVTMVHGASEDDGRVLDTIKEINIIFGNYEDNSDSDTNNIGDDNDDRDDNILAEMATGTTEVIIESTDTLGDLLPLAVGADEDALGDLVTGCGCSG